MDYWVITAALYRDDKTLCGVMLAQIENQTGRVIQKADLAPVEKVIQLIRDGKTVLALWPDDSEDRSLRVQIVQLPNGEETLETVPQGSTKDRRLDQIWSVDDMLAHMKAQLDAAVQ